MSTRFEDIPDGPGRHRGDTSEHESGQGVRAPNPPASDRSGEAPYRFRLDYHEGRGQYRVTTPDAAGDEEGYAEQGRYASDRDLAEALEDLPQQHRYVVLENTDTGDVYFGRENNLSDNWTGGGDFDQATLFATEDEAATYAEQRRRAMEEDGGKTTDD